MPLTETSLLSMELRLLSVLELRLGSWCFRGSDKLRKSVSGPIISDKETLALKTTIAMQICLALSLTAVSTVVNAEPVTLQGAIRLALTHATEMAAAESEVVNATQTYLEARNAYIPQLSIGSNVGYAYGFPLSLEGSAPTLFNVNAQSPVWNPAQKDNIRAAKADISATKALSRLQREQLIWETAASYIELSKLEEELRVLYSERGVASNVADTVARRIEEGMDSAHDLTKAKVIAAQTRMHVANAEGSMDLLKTRLSQLTGLPSDAIETLRDSIPALHQAAQADAEVARVAAADSAEVENALWTAKAKEWRAKGEHKALYPSADFAVQYGLINTSLTNFEQFFVPGSFRPHNVTVGLVLRLPLLDASQRARAAAADAEALRARSQSEHAKNNVALNAVKAQHDVQQLSAALDLAQLRYQLSQTDLEAVETRMAAQTATLKELQNAAIESAERTIERIGNEINLAHAQLQLLRATSELEKWAFSSPNSSSK